VVCKLCSDIPTRTHFCLGCVDDKSERKKRRSSVSSDTSESDLELSEIDSLPSSPVHQNVQNSPSSKRDNAIISQLKSPKKKSKETIVAQSTCTGDGSCELCKSGTPYYLHSSVNPGWRESILAIFQFFPKRRTKSEWIRLQRSGEEVSDSCEIENAKSETEWLYFPDAYTYVENHWNLICPPQHKDRSFTELNWRKTMQDTFSHNRSYFSNGKKVFGRTGFWRISDKAPLHNILKESNRIQVEKLASKFQRASQAIEACMAEQVQVLPALPLVAEEVLQSQPTERKPVEKASTTAAFSSLSFLLDAIDALENRV
jgi:hypothetical protein